MLWQQTLHLLMFCQQTLQQQHLKIHQYYYWQQIHYQNRGEMQNHFQVEHYQVALIVQNYQELNREPAVLIQFVPVAQMHLELVQEQLPQHQSHQKMHLNSLTEFVQMIGSLGM
jgi:hypothetical protein